MIAITFLSLILGILWMFVVWFPLATNHPAKRNLILAQAVAIGTFLSPILLKWDFFIAIDYVAP